jgi:hypothetical protein
MENKTNKMNSNFFNSLIPMFFSLIFSCAIIGITIDFNDKKYPRHKPFIIIDKHKWSGYDTYKYIDTSGIISTWIEDVPNKYNIGDTIK